MTPGQRPGAGDLPLLQLLTAVTNHLHQPVTPASGHAANQSDPPALSQTSLLPVCALLLLLWLLVRWCDSGQELPIAVQRLCH